MSKVLDRKYIKALSTVKDKIDNEKEDIWVNSKNRWIKDMMPGSKGKAGELFIEEWFKLENITVLPSINGESDRLISGFETEIKLSTLWDRGILCFQQIRDQDYDYIFFIGVMPDEYLFWSVPKEIALANSIPQHSGKDGNDTKWLLIDPYNIPEWLKIYGGKIDKGLAIYKSQIKNRNI
jgi:hypothetical protein